MGSDPIKLRLELNGQTYVLESWHKKKIRNATLDDAYEKIEDEMHEDYPSFDSLLRKINNLRGTDD